MPKGSQSSDVSTERDPENFVWLRDLALSFNKVGDVRLRTGDANGAAANYEQALANLRRLSEHDANNTLWLQDLNVTLNKLGDAKLGTDNMAPRKRAMTRR